MRNITLLATVAASMFLQLAATAAPKTYYIAPDGKDTNKGTIESPFATFNKAQEFVQPGDTVYFRGGVYRMREDQYARYSETEIMKRYTSRTGWLIMNDVSKSGEEGKPIHYFAYPGERPIIDMQDIKPPFGAVKTAAKILVFHVRASWIHFKGLEIIGTQVTDVKHASQSECFRNEGSHNIYEQLSMHDGMAIGFFLTTGSYNLVLNCDAYRNHDDVSGGGRGGNTDGFGFHGDAGSIHNVIRGCRAWWNSDDGYDIINNAETVIVENCWAFYNGFKPGKFESAGDGTGFKMGGYGASPTKSHLPDFIPGNIVHHCLAYRNKVNGFYANHHTIAGHQFYNNTAYRNNPNYCLLSQQILPGADRATDCDGFNHILRNNIALSYEGMRDVTRLGTSVDVYNTFTPGFGVEVTADDFINVIDDKQLEAPRKADGSLPDIDFMHLKKGSDLIDKGCYVGIPYNGKGVDLGAFETNYE